MDKSATAPDSTSSERSFDWQDIFPWLIIIRALRPAVSFRLLILSALGLVAMIAGWRMFWNVLGPRQTDIAALSPEKEEYPVLTMVAAGLEEGESWPAWPWTLRGDQFGYFKMYVDNTTKYDIDWIDPVEQLTLPFQLLFFKQLTLTELAYVLLCGAWALAVWAYFGGMITRTVALRLTIDEHVSWRKASTFARARWSSYFGAPIFPLFGIVVATVPIAVLGLIAKADFGVLIAGILWPLALIGGFFMTLLLVGLAFGWPLMWSTISTEGTDAFDALGRSYAYVYQRPLHLLFYALVAVVAGTLGYLFVAAFAAVVIHCTEWAATWGASSARISEVAVQGLESGAGHAGSWLISFWKSVVVTLVASFSIAYLWSASTAIYLLLRRSVDAAEMDEVELDDGGEHYGMPPLETDEAGVPGAADVDATDDAQAESDS